MLLQAEGEHPAFIPRPGGPFQPHIRSASASEATCRPALIFVLVLGFDLGPGDS